MKKTVALLLSILIIAVLFAGCGKGDTERSGKEMAKLMLAADRLDSKLFSTEGKDSSFNVVHTGIRPMATFSGSDFEKECNMLSYFESHMANVRSQAEAAATLIDEVKNYVSFTDVWINGNTFGIQGRLMLSVEANSELLLKEDDGILTVCRRYTDNDANDVYEIYKYYEDGIADSYLLYIPDKRYEYSEIYKSDEYDNLYIVADNSRGYWNMFTANPVDGRVNIQNLIATNDSTFVNYAEINSSGYSYLNYTDFTDVGQNCDVLAVGEADFTIDLAAFSGIASVTTDSDNLITSFKTTSGKTVNVQDEFLDGRVRISGGNAAEQGEITDGHLMFWFNSENDLKTNLSNFTTVLSELGISCLYNLSDITSNIPEAVSIGKKFGSYYKWNDCLMDSLSSFEKAQEADNAKHTALMQEYEDRKDFKTLKVTSKGFSFEGYEFATITSLKADSVTYKDGKISVSGLNATAENLSVFDAGEEYSIHLALAKLNDDAAAKNQLLSTKNKSLSLLSVVPMGGTVDADYTSAVILQGENLTNTAYTSGDSFSLSQNATFTLPDCEEEGVYTAAVYVATADGIRVSEMIPVSFSENVSYEGVSESGISYKLGLNEHKELIAVYGQDFLFTSLPEKSAGYSYEEVCELLERLILAKGYPIDSAALETYDKNTETGTLAKLNGTFKGITCRMKYADKASGTERYAYVSIP